MNFSQKALKALRYTFLTAVIILGLLTIIGTGGGDSGSGGGDSNNGDIWENGSNGGETNGDEGSNSNGNGTTGKTRDFDAPEEFMDNFKVANAISALNFPTYLAKNPPNIEGLYLTDGTVTYIEFSHPVEEDLIGEKVSSEICLYNQTHDGLITFSEIVSMPGADMGLIGEGSGNYITGSNNSFTIWQEVETEFPGTGGCKVYNAAIISGTKRTDGDLEFRSLSVKLDEINCPQEIVIANRHETEGDAYWRGTCGNGNSGGHTQYTATASAGPGGGVTPLSRSVESGSTASFTVTPNSGYTSNTSVGGTCPAGSWSGSTYTTGSISSDCSVSFSFMTSGQDHGDSIETATAINPNSSTQGEIYPSGDNDYFRIDLTASGTLTIYTTGNTDTYGYLRDAQGYVLAENDDSASSYNFSISRSVSVGTYYAQVKDYGSGTGAYTLVSEFSGSVTQHTVNSSAGTGGGVTPSSRTVSDGSTASFTVSANLGYTRNTSVGGTCPSGSWSGSTYTTGAISGNCSVSFSFSQANGTILSYFDDFSVNTAHRYTSDTSKDGSSVAIEVTEGTLKTTLTIGEQHTIALTRRKEGYLIPPGRNFVFEVDVMARTPFNDSIVNGIALWSDGNRTKYLEVLSSTWTDVKFVRTHAETKAQIEYYPAHRQWHMVKVERQGKKYKCWVDNELIYDDEITELEGESLRYGTYSNRSSHPSGSAVAFIDNWDFKDL